MIPVLGADIAAGTAGNIHLTLIGIAAVGADPNKLAVIFLNLNLAVKTAFLTVVGLGVQFGLHDVVVDILHQFQNSIDILLHNGHFHIANGTTWRKLLEISFKT